MNQKKNNIAGGSQYLIDEMQTGDSWRLFRIMAEFVDGFELLSQQEPMVSVFGSAEVGQDEVFYKKAQSLGAKLANSGIAVITGGGPGIMEAANRGAFESGGKSIGVEIDIPNEQSGNKFTNQSIRLRYFFVRKVMLVKYSQAFVIFPGGFGTMDEMFESLTLIRTTKILPFPIILYGTDYWGGLLGWMRERMLGNGFIDPDDIDLIHLTDDLDEVVRICQKSIVDSTKSQWIMKGRT